LSILALIPSPTPAPGRKLYVQLTHTLTDRVDEEHM
jgi:hypothetical protein